MGFLLLGIDSLIACFAVGALVSRQNWGRYAGLFGLCDAGAFLLGTALHFNVPDGTAKRVEALVLVALGLYLVVIAIGARRVADTRWTWAIPFVLTVDNITYGLIDGRWTNSVLGQAGEQALSSALLALIGLFVSAAVVRAVPAMQRSRVVTTGVAGAALIVAAPVMVAVG